MPPQPPPPVKYFTKNGKVQVDESGGFYLPEKVDVIHFHSGLARVDVSIIGTQANIEQRFNSLKSGSTLPIWASGGYIPVIAPSIFPTPLQEQIGAGLARLKLTAYGISNFAPGSTLTNTGFATTFGSRVLVLNKSYPRTESETRTVNNQPKTFTVTVTTNITEKWIVDTATTTLAADSTLSSTAIAPSAPSLAKKLIRRTTLVTTDGNNSYSPIPTAISINWSTEIVSVTRRNFGKVDEVEVTFEPIPYI